MKGRKQNKKKVRPIFDSCPLYCIKSFPSFKVLPWNKKKRASEMFEMIEKKLALYPLEYSAIASNSFSFFLSVLSSKGSVLTC